MMPETELDDSLAAMSDRELLELVAGVAIRLQQMLDGMAASPMFAAFAGQLGIEQD